MGTERLPVLFVSHGGGPWPFIDGMRELYATTAMELAALPARLPERPRAILAVSGHWEAGTFSVSTATQPPTEYDYYGFPEHTYHIRYPAAGSPELAERVIELLGRAGMQTVRDAQRGFDHGVFVPLHLMFPDADIPVVTLSVKADHDPAEHLRAGGALEPLREEGVLILGSGLTYHNLQQFGPQGAEASERFEEWLNGAVSEPDPARRARLLEGWEEAPFARFAHPREDHLIPLMVVAGAAGSSRGRRLFSDRVYGVKMASYLFTDE